MHNEKILFIKTKELLVVLTLGTMHWPASCAYFMLGTVETCSKTVHPRELNKHIQKSGRNKREELDGQEKEKEKEGSKCSMRHIIPSRSYGTAFYSLGGQSCIDHLH